MGTDLFTVTQAAAMIGVHPHTVRNWIKDKLIRPTLFPAAKRYGKVRHKHYRVALSEVERINSVRKRGLPITAA